MTQTEAMKLALEALESCTPEDTSTSHVIYAWHDEELVNKAIKALEEALAKQENLIPSNSTELEKQEQPKVRTGNCLLTGVCATEGHKIQPKQEQGEPERCHGCEACINTACGRDECPKGWPKAAQPEQEPVACVVPHGATMRLEWASVDAAHNAKIGPLYTTPPQRPWVGLSEKEAHELWESTDSDDDWELMKRTEAKLKEKNT